MAHALLGDSFDIHGGGNDLMFPTTRTRSRRAAAPIPRAIRPLWMHNEMLQVEGKKMSKSLGNFFTVRDLLDQGVPGEVIRFVFLSTTRERLYLYDTTLRDGQQTQGCSSRRPRSADRPGARRAGVDYIEGGWPGANPTDSEFFAAAPATRATLTAFGMTKRAGRSAANDEVLAAVVNAGTPAVCLVGKTHDFHVDHRAGHHAGGEPREHRASVAHLVALGREALFDAEHFFDGYKAEPRLCARLPAGRARGRRALGRALRHQRRHAAGRDRRDHRAR
jgi:hypothetical protein